MQDTTPNSETLDGSHSQLDPLTTAVLDYLEHRFPGYPFETTVDAEFVDELKADFPDIDLLEEIKTLRWYLNNQALSVANPRATLRRWLARARPAKRR
ncbi:MAG: hypothetical protein V3V11_10680 [Vicinamibacteria bacterium]